MSVRQKFRSTLEVRKSDSICWRCALVLPRYASTLQRSEFPDSSSKQSDRDHTLVQTQQERSEGVRVSIQRRTDTRPYWSSNSQKRDVAIYLDRRRRASLERRENSANDRPTPSIQKFDRLTNYQHSSKLPNSHSTSAPPTVRKHLYVPKETSPSSLLGHGITGKASGRSVGGQDAPISAGASFRRYHWASKPDHKMESSRSSQEQWEANTKSQGRPYATAAVSLGRSMHY